jgi:uncharacterized repeat protein (TIGR01451 family)
LSGRAGGGWGTALVKERERNKSQRRAASRVAAQSGHSDTAQNYTSDDQKKAVGRLGKTDFDALQFSGVTGRQSLAVGGGISTVFAFLRRCQAIFAWSAGWFSASRISRRVLTTAAVFVLSLLGNTPSQAFTCPDAILADPKDALVATYYVTAKSCSTTDTGPDVLLSAFINDETNQVNVTFSPTKTVVTSSVTTGPGCTGSFTPPTSGNNVAGYSYGFSTTCSVSIALADGGSMSFVTDNDEFGFATIFRSVNLTPGNYPSWKLTTTPNKSSYTKVGEAIGYSYTLTNTGNVAINSFGVAGNKTGSITCLAIALAPGASTTCSSTYTTVAGDVGNPIAYDATATGTPAAGTLAPAMDSGSITFAVQPALTVVPTPNPASFTAAGQAIAYSFKLTNAGNVTINSIAMTGTKTGSIACTLMSLAPGADTTCTSSYTTVAADVGGSIPYTATATGTPTAGALAPVAVKGTITFTAQPVLTIAATPNPASFSNAGQAIAYSFKLTNTGNVTINSLAVTGTKIGTVSCVASGLAAGASTTCTSSYTTVAGDVGAPIPYSATANGTPAGGTLSPAVANGSIAFTALPALAIATTPNPTTFSKAGQVIAYSYKVTNTGNVTVSSLAVNDTKVTGISCAATTLPLGASTTCSGSYTTTAADVLAASISSAATANGMFGTTAVSSAAVSTTLQIDANAVRQATQSAIRNFMNRRAEILTSVQPDETRKHQQLPGWLFGNSAEEQDPEPDSTNAKSARGRTDTPSVDDRMARRPTRGQPVAGDIATDRASGRTSLNPFGVSGSTDDAGGGRFAFATSLSKLRQNADEMRAARDSGPNVPMGLGATSRSTIDRRAEPSRFDVWAEGAMAYYSDNSIGASQQGHAALLYMGVDYRIHPAILLGALVQLDWVSESTPALGASASASGQGWMAGPYVSVRLTRNLFFDARAAWGQSDNRVDPLGVYTDKFSTERSLVSAKLTGNWAYGNLRFRPSAEIVHFHETQEAYTNQINIHIPEQSISLGRVSVGPEIGYRFQHDNGAVFEPFVGVKGVWDFDKTADTTVAGIAVGDDPFHVMVELGATYATPSGISLRGSFAYDGIGDSDLRAYYGRGSITVPFN